MLDFKKFLQRKKQYKPCRKRDDDIAQGSQKHTLQSLHKRNEKQNDVHKTKIPFFALIEGSKNNRKSCYCGHIIWLDSGYHSQFFITPKFRTYHDNHFAN